MPSVQWVNSWWWAEELSETCRISCRSKFGKLVYLFGFIIKKLNPSFHKVYREHADKPLKEIKQEECKIKCVAPHCYRLRKCRSLLTNEVCGAQCLLCSLITSFKWKRLWSKIKYSLTFGFHYKHVVFLLNWRSNVSEMLKWHSACLRALLLWNLIRGSKLICNPDLTALQLEFITHGFVIRSPPA